MRPNRDDDTDMSRTCLAIVLAAGEGTRMRSARPKVLHAIGHRSLLAHALDAAKRAGAGDIAVVVGPGRTRLRPKCGASRRKRRFSSRPNGAALRMRFSPRARHSNPNPARRPTIFW